MMRQGFLLATILAAAAAARGQPVAVPNASFEEGQGSPTGWTLSGGRGEWLDSAAADGRRAIAVTGKGDDHSFWQSGPLPLAPGAVHVLRFRARSADASGGTPTSGPPFANRDLGRLPAEWTQFESVFVAPANLKPADARLRFGQWNVKGTVAFDDVQLFPAQAVYARQGDMALGEGERIIGNEYVFDAPLGRESRNHSRALARHNCGFNSDRWVFGPESEVVYRHHVAGRRQKDVEVGAAVVWHAAGELVVEAAADGKSWQPLGTLAKVSSGTFKVPAAMLPADEVWVRLRAQPAPGGGKPGASLQVGYYTYRAALDGGPASLVGTTRFFAVEAVDPRFDVRIADAGEMVAGDFNFMTCIVRNLTDKPLPAVMNVIVEQPERVAIAGLDSGLQQLFAGEHVFRSRYLIGGAGPGRLRIFFSDSPLGFRTEAAPSRAKVVIDKGPVRGFLASTDFSVPEFYNPDYGQALPGSGDSVGLWWASSGWKVPLRRSVPAEKGEAVAIRAARNEAEAAQVVVRAHEKPLRGLTVKAEALKGPGVAVLPAENIDILRVGYVNIVHPTDHTGCVGPWPDPLPPVAGPIDVQPGCNQPFWVRVRVPAGALAGRYEGKIRMAAEGWSAAVPVRVEVYGFALPDRMTCETSFGFSHGNVWRYHKLERADDRRAVLEKYLACLAAHHISPYDPAPLDPFKVTWPKFGRDAKAATGAPAAPQDLTPAFDWSAWDAAMTRAVDVHRFNTFMVHVPGLGGGTFHQRFDPALCGFKEDAPEYKALLRNYCRAVQEHLRGKDWLKYAYVYWFDEPDRKDYEFVMNGFRKLKEAAPDLRRMLTEQVEPDLVGGPNLWCPVTPEYNHARAEQRRKAGERFWWYVCCGPKAPYATLFIDHPATEMRVWLWQTFQRRIDGILVWQTNYWTSETAYPDRALPQNPYEDPMSWVSGYGTEKGARRPWGNGDGRFMYPPESAAGASPAGPVLDGPVESIRLEMLRDGIEDYEYLVILRRLLAGRGAKLAAGERQRLEALLEVPEEIT
ncbi:MAG: DUF4091 domain-containing protein, partial [Planctomycetes bacterium]|nr:DUF4091 domain-containing protein [Planctomycetota bacterium]